MVASQVFTIVLVRAKRILTSIYKVVVTVLALLLKLSSKTVTRDLSLKLVPPSTELLSSMKPKSKVSSAKMTRLLVTGILLSFPLVKVLHGLVMFLLNIRIPLYTSELKEC